MNYLRYFPFVVASVLLTLAGVFHSAAFAAATVAALVVIAVRDSIYEYLQAKVFKQTIPEEVKRALNDLAQRTTSIELGIKNRGF